jgi:hypothetical protein
MTKAIERVADAIDIETYIICRDESEGKLLAMQLGRELNLGNVDVLFEEFDGYGIRVRIRKYIYRPGTRYRWLDMEQSITSDQEVV